MFYPFKTYFYFLNVFLASNVNTNVTRNNILVICIVFYAIHNTLLMQNGKIVIQVVQRMIGLQYAENLVILHCQVVNITFLVSYAIYNIFVKIAIFRNLFQ